MKALVRSARMPHLLRIACVQTCADTHGAMAHDGLDPRVLFNRASTRFESQRHWTAQRRRPTMQKANPVVRIAASVLTVISAAATAKSPQTSEPQPAAMRDDATIDTVTVEARRRLERELSTYVNEITMRSYTEAIARWQLPICPLVAGLPFDEGKFVFQRVSQIASEAGIPLDSPDCKPNLLIVLTREPQKLLGAWWRAKPTLFNTERGVAGIKRKIRADGPVRIFHNACNVPPGLAKTFGKQILAHCNTGGTLGSRLTWSTVRAIYSVIVVVDKREIEGVAIGPLTDYVAMISLAQLRPEPDLGTAPTILRLFDESNPASPNLQPPEGLSAWDRTFLKSLYETDASSVAHLSEIKSRMHRSIAK